VRELPFRDGRIGAIWCSAVLLHLDRSQVVRALREFFRVLEGGGLAQISVKEIENDQEHVAEPIPDRPGLLRHFYFYDLDDLKDISARVGFEVAGDWTEEQVDQLTGDATVEHWIKLLLRKPSE
jgi:predicted SAM-dependent methyltransferase